MTDHQLPEDRDFSDPDQAAPVPADAHVARDEAARPPSGEGEMGTSFVPPPGPPPVAVDSREGGPFAVSGNGHHEVETAEDASAQFPEWIPEAPDTPEGLEHPPAAPEGAGRVAPTGAGPSQEEPDPQDELGSFQVVPVREELPPDKQLEVLLREVISQRGSDLHLVAGAPPFVRKDGHLSAVPGWEPLRPEAVKAMVSGILSDRQRDRLGEDLELDGAHSLPEARFRVNVHFQRGSMAAAFHLIPYEIQGIEELGLPAVVADFARLRSGLVLVTGPSGSGKSTTLAAMVDVVNAEREAYVLTVEDPIEFLHRHKRAAVSQREVGPDTASFARALGQALRQDPDVIMVGELRDTQTIATVITAAEAGHLVFASMHTHDAAQTVDRLVDVFPPHQQQQIRVQLSLSLQGVVAQQLVPAADGTGRLAACEVLIATSAVRTLIREGKSDQLRSAILAGRKLGMMAMDATLAALMHDGRISHDTAFQYAHSPEQLSKQLSAGYAGGLPTVTG